MFGKDSKEWQMFAEYFKLCEKFWELPEKDAESFYDTAYKESGDFAEKYKTEDQFSYYLAMSLLDRIKHEWRARNGKAKKEG